MPLTNIVVEYRKIYAVTNTFGTIVKTKLALSI